MPIPFIANPTCTYKYDYEAIFRDVVNTNANERKDKAISVIRNLVLDDLFYIVHFIMQLLNANQPFIVNACQEVEHWPISNTLAIWAREHYKTTISIAEVIQKVLKNPERCISFFAYARPLAKTMLRGVKQTFENSDALKAAFPDIVWQRPENESPKWSEDDGLILRRKSISRRESTIEAWGLVEGMPVGRHFDDRVYDDIETDDLVENIDMMRKTIHKFEMSKYLGTQDGTHRIWGTHYHHAGPLAYLREKKNENRDPLYYLSLHPGTDNGKEDGKPILVSDARHAELKSDTATYNTQFLCNPTPKEKAKLKFEYLVKVRPQDVPFDILKFMVIDQAGDDATNKSSGDAWTLPIIGVKPAMDNVGASDIYILDLESGPMEHSEAIDAIARMYLRNGIIHQLGVEKVSTSTTEMHIVNALKAHGRMLSEENGNLVLLRPGNRKKHIRIEAALQWPLNNGKIHYVDTIPVYIMEALRVEMEKFPFFHVDILDALAYLYDMLAKFSFNKFDSTYETDMSGVYCR